MNEIPTIRACDPPRMAVNAVLGGFARTVVIAPNHRLGTRIDTVTFDRPGLRVFVGTPSDRPRPAVPYLPGAVLGFVAVPQGVAAIASDLITVVRDGRVDCCDLHGEHCEPPAELCCRRCTEVGHPDHPPGVDCTWTSGQTAREDAT